MALDFPASPTNGQLDSSGQWTYNSTKQAWQAVPLTQVKTVTSPTPPSSPANGDQWFNTNDGTLYIYYTDANSSQWVESRAPVTADGYISPNYVINGGFDIWQRGTGATVNSGIYSNADRWVSGSNSTTITRDSDVPVGISQYSLKIVATSANSIFQRIEASNATVLAGKTVTFSFYYKRTSGTGNVDVRFYYPSATDNFGTVTQIGSTVVLSTAPSSSWTRYSTTIILPSNVASGLQVLINNDGNTTSYITGVQLEEGTTATPFRRNGNSVAEELSTCQRYCYVAGLGYSGAVVATYGSGINTTGAAFYTQFPVTLRRTPTFSWAGGFVGYGLVAANGTVTSMTGSYMSPVGARIDASGSSYSAGTAYQLHTNTTTGYILFDAEL